MKKKTNISKVGILIVIMYIIITITQISNGTFIDEFSNRTIPEFIGYYLFLLIGIGLIVQSILKNKKVKEKKQ